MKKQICLFLIMLSILFTACTTVRPANSMEDTASIKIECQNRNNLQQTVLQYLRFAKARDIKIDANDEFITIIGAAFRLQDISLNKVDDLKVDLQRLPGVLYVEVEINKTIVRQPF